MSCDLLQIFGNLAARIPDDRDQSILLDSALLPVPPATLSTDRLVIDRGRHYYDSIWRTDRLSIYADKSTYVHLALLTASMLLNPLVRQVEVALVHPYSHIRRLRIRREGTEIEEGSGLRMQPTSLLYFPSSVAKHPWPAPPGGPADLPGFFLTNSDEMITTDEGWDNRDTVVGFGSDRGAANFVEFLLDASRASSSVDEFELEGEGGFRGVAPFSCEVRLLLPGACGWSHGIGPDIPATAG
jgi:hypothetical protein